MGEPLGCLCLVLHGHLPYVLHHGTYPHGEAWLYEAAAETYLPLLDVIGEAALHKARPALTIGLVLYGAQQADTRHFRARDENIYSKVRKRMGAWLQDVL